MRCRRWVSKMTQQQLKALSSTPGSHTLEEITDFCPDICTSGQTQRERERGGGGRRKRKRKRRRRREEGRKGGRERVNE